MARKIITDEELNLLAAERGGQCLSSYETSAIKLSWKCHRDHQWNALYTSVKRGSWCKECFVIDKKEAALNRAKQYASNFDGQCLSTTYEGKNTHLQWECDEGHTWVATMQHVSKGYWCPTCAGRSPAALLESAREYARNEGGKCLSEQIQSHKDELLFECSKGHAWKATYQQISRRTYWCRFCESVPINTYQSEDGIDLLNQRIESYGQCLSDYYVNAFHPMQWRCKEGHTFEATMVQTRGRMQRKTFCPTCIDKGHKRRFYRRLEVMAHLHDGLVISKAYTHSRTPMRFQSIDDHQWSTPPENILRGHWCRSCSDESRRHTIDDMHKLAVERNYKCLSTEYYAWDIPLTWECDKGHIYESAPRSFRLNGCKRCAYDRRLYTLEDLQQVAADNKGKCLSKTYLGSKNTQLWECANGHQWETTFKVILSGSWCRHCANLRRSLALEDIRNVAIERKGLLSWKI